MNKLRVTNLLNFLLFLISDSCQNLIIKTDLSQQSISCYSGTSSQYNPNPGLLLNPLQYSSLNPCAPVFAQYPGANNVNVNGQRVNPTVIKCENCMKGKVPRCTHCFLCGSGDHKYRQCQGKTGF